MKHRSGLALAAAVAGLATMTVAAIGAPNPSDPSETNFRVTTTRDLVQLCEAIPNDAVGIAALHFCHGFAVGAYQYHQVVAAAENKSPLFCEPNPRPTRNAIIGDFVSWANQNPKVMDTPPVEGMFRYLAQRYPCRG
jgi:hypothetical protein